MRFKRRHLELAGFITIKELGSNTTRYISYFKTRRPFIGIHSPLSQIQPITLNISTTTASPLAQPLPPQIQPNYYSAIVVAEAIGKTNDTSIIELNISNADVAGYAFYEGGTIARAVLLNMNAYLTNQTDSRSTEQVSFVFSGTGGGAASGSAIPGHMTIKRLKIGHADDTAGVLWGGQTYETADALVQGVLKTEDIPVTANVGVSQSEAVLITFQN